MSYRRTVPSFASTFQSEGGKRPVAFAPDLLGRALLDAVERMGRFFAGSKLDFVKEAVDLFSNNGNDAAGVFFLVSWLHPLEKTPV